MSTALLTDKYELTMLDAALRSGVAHRKSVFTVFTRSLPQGRRYGVLIGNGRIIDAIKDFRFTPEQIEWLRQDGALTEDALTYLANYKFGGTITAYDEGETYFPNSPLMTVEGTFAECVLLETLILSIMNHDSAVGAAASRMVAVARGRDIIEMGSRRTQEQSAVSAARAAYIAGFAATSNLEAGMRYGIPTRGTSAHAFTLAHPTEKDAFAAQVAALGVKTSLLVDTYDTPQGILNALEAAGRDLGGIRIDSGDLYQEAVDARQTLDEHAAYMTKIVVSSDLDEYVIDELMDRQAPIDVFGAGTRVVTGSGHPTCGMVYKLVAIEDDNGNMVPVAKKASGKKSIGGKKEAWRLADNLGDTQEVVTTNLEWHPEDAHLNNYRKMTRLHVLNGEVVHNPDLETIRETHRQALRNLPRDARTVVSGAPAVTTVNENGEVL